VRWGSRLVPAPLGGRRDWALRAHRNVARAWRRWQGHVAVPCTRLGGGPRGRARLVPVPAVGITGGRRPVGCAPARRHFRATRPPLRPAAADGRLSRLCSRRAGGYRILAPVMWTAATAGPCLWFHPTTRPFTHLQDGGDPIRVLVFRTVPILALQGHFLASGGRAFLASRSSPAVDGDGG
jgi:hypothetical protein